MSVTPRLSRAVRLLGPFCLAACTARGENTRAGMPGTLSVDVPGWSAREVFAVGGPDADPEMVLFTVLSVVEDRSGNAYVLNYGDRRILVVSPEGRFLRSIGRGGEGPGEFRAPTALGMGADSLLYVFDPPGARVSAFRLRDGRFVSSLRIGSNLGIPMEMRTAPDGSILIGFQAVPGLAQPRGGPVVAALDPTTGRATPVATLDSMGPRQIPVTVTKGDRRVTTFLDPPFAPRPVWTAEGAGRILFGSGARFEVWRARGGISRLVLTERRAALPVTGVDRARFLEDNTMLRDARVAVEFPRVKPYFSGLHLSPDGRLWLLVDDAAGQTWEVRELSGPRLGRVVLPPGSRLVGLSRNGMFVVGRDGDGAETLRKYRLTTPGE